MVKTIEQMVRLVREGKTAEEIAAEMDLGIMWVQAVLRSDAAKKWAEGGKENGCTERGI